MGFKEQQEKLTQLLKDNLTAENTDFTTQANNLIKELGEEHKKLQDECTKLKDKLVDVVSKTEFKDTPKDEIHDEPKSLDEAIADGVNNIIKNRKDK